MWELLLLSEGSRCESGLSHLRTDLKSALQVDGSCGLKTPSPFLFLKAAACKKAAFFVCVNTCSSTCRYWCELALSSSGGGVGAVGSIYMSKCPWAKPKIAPEAALSAFECAWMIIPNFSKGYSAISVWIRAWTGECALRVVKVTQKVLFTVRKWPWLDGESFGACMLIWSLSLFLITNNNKEPLLSLWLDNTRASIF